MERQTIVRLACGVRAKQLRRPRLSMLRNVHWVGADRVSNGSMPSLRRTG